jgi:hypothetical protein
VKNKTDSALGEHCPKCSVAFKLQEPEKSEDGLKHSVPAKTVKVVYGQGCLAHVVKN